MARIKFTGEFRELQDFVERVARSPARMVEVNKQLAEEALDLVREGFENSEDPYGKPWDKPKFRNGRPLEDTGGLKASWRRRLARRDSFEIFSPKESALYAQEGTGIYGPRKEPIRPLNARALRFAVPGGVMFVKEVKGSPQRKMVPDAGELPSRWRERFVDTALETMSVIYGVRR